VVLVEVEEGVAEEEVVEVEEGVVEVEEEEEVSYLFIKVYYYCITSF